MYLHCIARYNRSRRPPRLLKHLHNLALPKKHGPLDLVPPPCILGPVRSQSKQVRNGLDLPRMYGSVQRSIVRTAPVCELRIPRLGVRVGRIAEPHLHVDIHTTSLDESPQHGEPLGITPCRSFGHEEGLAWPLRLRRNAVVQGARDEREEASGHLGGASCDEEAG